jgi:hypothetical protein
VSTIATLLRPESVTNVDAVGMRRRVPRLDEAAHDVAHAGAVDDRQRSLRGVAHDRDVAHPLDRARIGERRDRTDDTQRSKIDDGQPRLGVARDEGDGPGRTARSQRERRDCGSGDEIATIHGREYGRSRARGPVTVDA